MKIAETKQATLKQQNFRWITFEDFVEYGKSITESKLWHNGMPWSFLFSWDEKNRFPVTHENDSCYLIGSGLDSVKFHRGHALCLTETGKLFTLLHPIGIMVTNEPEREGRIQEILDSITSDKPSNWLEKAKARKDNRPSPPLKALSEEEKKKISVLFASYFTKLTPVDLITVHGEMGSPRNLSFDEIYDKFSHNLKNNKNG